MLEAAGAPDILCFASDYPHWDFDDPAFMLKRLPEAWRERVMHENAAALYGERLGLVRGVTDWHDVGSLDELERDGRLVARVGGPRGRGRLDRAGRACRDPQPLPAQRRADLPRDRARAGDGRARALRASREPVLRCPWHGWEFDLETGACLDDPALRAAVYPVRVEGDRVLVRA